MISTSGGAHSFDFLGRNGGIGCMLSGVIDVILWVWFILLFEVVKEGVGEGVDVEDAVSLIVSTSASLSFSSTLLSVVPPVTKLWLGDTENLKQQCN